MTGTDQLMEFRPGSSYRISFEFDDLFYSISIDGKIIPQTEKKMYPNYGRNFAFGFRIPVGGDINLLLSEFQIE